MSSLFCHLHGTTKENRTVLRCGHSFCPQCLEILLSRRGNSCPLCSQPINASPVNNNLPISSSPLPNIHRERYESHRREQVAQQQANELKKLEEIPSMREWESSIKSQLRQKELREQKAERAADREYLKRMKEEAHRERENRIRKERGLPPKEDPSQPTSPPVYTAQNCKVQIRYNGDVVRHEFPANSTLRNIRSWFLSTTALSGPVKFFRPPRTELSDYNSTLSELNLLPAILLIAEVQQQISPATPLNHQVQVRSPNRSDAAAPTQLRRAHKPHRRRPV
ncbi:hypothetical protein GEMRC1_002441 [Eukaryota sp. GEM-RC1]